MYREIITPDKNNSTIEIPKEYWNQAVEVLVLPFSYIKKEKNSKLDLKKLLEIGVHDTEEVRIKDWKIDTF